MPTGASGRGARVPRLLRVPLAWLILALSLGATAAVWVHNRNQAEREGQRIFESASDRVESNFLQLLDGQEDLMRACQGFFESSNRVEADEWRSFVTRVCSEDDNPGLLSLGYAPLLPKPGSPAPPVPDEPYWGALAQAQRAPDLQAPLAYAFPEPGSLWGPAGTDLLADAPLRRAALDSLAKSHAAATPLLPAGGGGPRMRFVLAMPVFAGQPFLKEARRAGAPLSTTGPGLLAAAYDPVGLLARSLPDDGDLALELRDASGVVAEAHVAGRESLKDTRYRRSRAVAFAGQAWTLDVRATAPFVPLGAKRASLLIAAGGVLFSLLLFFATALLVLDRARAQRLAAQLGESEAKYRELIEGASDLVYQADEEGRFTYLNAASRPLFGYEPEEMVGRYIRDFLTPLSRVQAHGAHSRVLAGQVFQNYPLAFTRKDGETTWVHVNARALTDGGSDQPAGSQGTMRDVTAARRAQLALEESENKFRIVAETISCIVLLFDDCIRYVNGYATKMLGWEEEEIVGKPFWSLVHPEDQTMVRERGEARRRGDGVPARYEFRVSTKDGSFRWVDFTAGLVVLEGRPYGLATVFDVTDRVKAEEARLRMERKLLDAQKLESLGLLAGGVAHDFNNLLAAILGNAELAEELLQPGAEARTPLGHIQRACLRASELTRQMLAYAGRGRYVVEPLDLAHAVEGITGLMRASISRSIEVVLEPAPAPLLLEGDTAQIQQVILNLVTNASEAIGAEQGRITLRTGRRTLGPGDAQGLRAAEDLRSGPMVYIEVEDTGHGMDAATLERIFDPFFTTKFTGRGLGLAAMQGIVRGHGGGIEVRSEPGKGTRFRVYFPELPRIHSGVHPAPRLG